MLGDHGIVAVDSVLRLVWPSKSAMVMQAAAGVPTHREP
jgi:hypothetical protein